MMQDSFEAKIIRVDGLEQESLICKVFYNSRKYDDFRPLAQQRSLQLSGGGIFTFSFKSGEIQKSVSLKLSLFFEDGAHWLPLFEKNTLLDDLPQETAAPRFLIVLGQSKALTMIEETLEKLEESSLNVSESEKMKDSDCQSTFTRDFLESIESDLLENSFDEDHNSFFQSNDEKLSKIWEKEALIERNIESSKDSSFSKSSKVHKYEKILSELRNQMLKNEEYEENILKLTQNFNEQVERSHLRETSLIQLVQAKEVQAKQALIEISELRFQCQKLEIENKRLSDVNLGLNNQLNFSSVVFAELQSLRVKVQEMQRKTLEELEMKTNESTLNHLQRTPCRSRPGELDLKDSQNSSIFFDDLEDAVRIQTKLMNLPQMLVRDKEQTYLYGNRKISLFLENGELMCRLGVNFHPFQEFMKNFVLDTNAIQPIKKRFNVDKKIDSEYDEENFKEIAKVTRNRNIRKCCLKKNNCKY
jgi:hypothetical protein